MVRGGHGGPDVGDPRRVAALEMTYPRGAPRLVQRDPVGDPVAEGPGHVAGVRREMLRGFPCRPAAAVLQGLRQIPVIEGGVRGDFRLEQSVDEAIVESQPGRVNRPVAAGHDPRPRDGEPVGAHAKRLHHRDLMPAGIETWAASEGFTTSYDLDAVLPCVDAVMMLRVQRERMSGGFFPTAREYTVGYGLTRERLRTLQKHTVICHPGPMNRGLEIAADAADAAQSLVLDQVSAGVA